MKPLLQQVPHNESLVQQAQRNKEAYELDLKNQAGEILHKRQELMDRHQRTFVSLQEIMAKIINVKLVEVFLIYVALDDKRKFLVEKTTGVTVQWTTGLWQSVETNSRGS